MAISNKNMSVFTDLCTAMVEIAQQDRSAAAKEYRKEREAWEKAAGGKDVLAKAEAIRADAAENYDNRIAESEREAAGLLNESAAKIKKSQAALAVQEKLNFTKHGELQKWSDDLDKREATLDEDGKFLDGANAEYTERANKLHAEAAALDIREKRVAQREAAAERFASWRETAPR